MDVLWFRVSRRDSDTAETFGHMEAGRMLVMLNRTDYWQCAYVIPKGGIDAVKAKGLEAFRDNVAFMSPFLRDRLGEIASWDDVKLLTVAVDRLPRWHKPGLLCIGDAAHAMSPIGGVGINLAIQDAVAAANILAAPLQRGPRHERAARGGAAPAHHADARHPVAAGADPEQCAERGACGHRAAAARRSRPSC